MKTKTPLNRKLYLAFGAAILVLAGLGATSYRDLVESAESDRWVRHTHQALENLQDLNSAAEGVESSYRGYVITGKESYAESCRADMSIAEQREATVGGLTEDNRLQQSRLPDLERLSAAKFRFAEMVINLRRSQGFEAAAEAIRNGAGQQAMDEFQTLVRKMEDEEQRLLERRIADAKRRLRLAKIVLFLGTLMGVLIATGAGWTVRRDSAARDLAEEALREGEDRFRSMANNISQLAWMADEKGSTFWYNQRWFDYTGTTLEEMFGWGWQKVHHPDHVQRVLEKISRCFQSGEVWEDTFPLRGRDGNYRWFLSRAVPIHDSEGKVSRWFGTNTDISDHRDTENQLKQMESRYRGLLEAAPDAMVVVNQAGEIVLMNVQAEKQFGYRRDELIGQKVKNIIPEGFAERLISDATRSVADALAQQIGMGIELSGRRKNGSEFPIEIMLSPLESAQGILVTAAIRNISVRKAAEEHLGQMEDKRRLVEDALRESEERYRMLLDGIQDYAIFMMDPRGQILSWNAGAELIKGYKPDEIIGHNFSCFFPPEDIERGRPEEVLRLTVASGRHEEQGMRVRKDGSQFLAGVTFTALHDQAGNLRGFSEFSHDLTESKEAGAKYRGLLEAAPDAMVVVNQAGEIVLLNVQAEKQFGYSRDELVGQKVKNIIPEGFAERLIADGNRSAAEALAQQIGTGIELSGRRKDGSEFPIEIMLSPLESAEGILVTVAIRNISARKKSERVATQLENKATYFQGAHDELELRVAERTKELAVANQVLEQSNLELKQFAYIASHDLQSPLRSISGFVQLLKLEYEGKLDEQAQDWIRRTVQAIMRMQTLIRDLLSYSRVDARSLPFTKISFLDIVNDALTLLDSSIHDSGGQVTWDSLPEIMGDRSQLVQLMQNLIGNGLTYHGDKPPHIHISAERRGKEWIFSVRDNGIGIDPKYYEQIFEIFKRLHDQKEYPGTGIGLAVCRRVVNRHGGKIWVKSEPGHGTTFQFSIPEGTEQNNGQRTY